MGVVANFEFRAIDNFMLLAVAKPNVGNEYERIHFTDFDASDTRIYKKIMVKYIGIE